jgi:hypothetical protein
MKSIIILSFAISFFASIEAEAKEQISKRVPASVDECKPIEHPENTESDYSPTQKLIEQQKTCWEAADVFDKCPHGAMYSKYSGSSILDHSDSLIKKCEKFINKKSDLKKTYETLFKKYCKSKSDRGTRQEVAAQDECQRLLAISLGKLPEFVSDRD